MKHVLGVACGDQWVRAVLVAGGVVRHAAELQTTSEVTLEQALDGVLSRFPTPRRRTPTVRAAVGGSRAQLKRVSGLPLSTDPTVLAAVIRNATGTYFLHGNGPVLTGGVNVVDPGVVWAAAVDENTCRTIRTVCKTHKLRLTHVLPAALALPAACNDDPIVWNEGGVSTVIRRSETGIASVVRRSGVNSPTVPTVREPCTPLLELGALAGSYADAYGAAILDAPEWLRLSVISPVQREITSRQSGLITAVCAAAIAAIGLSPLAAVHASAKAEAATAAINRSGAATRIDPSLAELQLVSRLLAQADSVAGTRSSFTEILASFATLPTSVVVSRVEIGHKSCVIHVQGTNIDDVIAAIRRQTVFRTLQLSRRSSTAEFAPGVAARVELTCALQ